jgi:uncharacterized membrane protein YeaQ/YmgE (transglycosylase-associated protein family)
MFNRILTQALAFCTAERLSAGLVYLVGAIVGTFAARGFTPLQWAGAATAIIGAILVAVIVRTWPVKAKAST